MLQHLYVLRNWYGYFLLLMAPLFALLPTAVLHAQDMPPAQLHLFRVYYDGADELTELGASLDVWEIHQDEGYAIAPLDDAQLTKLQADGIRTAFAYRVPQGIQAISSAVDSSIAPAGTIPYFPCYRTTTALEQDMRMLADAHPQLAQWVDIGDSWEKTVSKGKTGHDLFALKITNTERAGTKFRLLIVAAVHARELTPAEIAARYVEYLIAYYGFDPDVTWLLDYGEIYIVPLANPDGREYADQLYYWRKNTNDSDGCTYADTSESGFGVDLNRNADMKWGQCESGGCSSTFACSPTFRGSDAASEPETIALQSYAESLFQDQRDEGLAASAPLSTTGAVISLHSYAQKVLYPWGWSSSAAPNRSGLQALGNRLAAPFNYVSCQTGDPGCLYETDGDYVDYVYYRLGVPAYTIELGTAFFEACSVFEDDVLQQATESLTLGFKYARMPYALTALGEVESVELARSRVMVGDTVTLTATLHLDASTTDSQHIRLTVDEPSWVDGAVSTAVTSTQSVTRTGTISLTLDTSALADGRHTLFLEAIDAAGNAGIPTAVFLDTMETSYAYMPFIGVREHFIGPQTDD